MLFADSGILNRHFPSGKVDHPGAELFMNLVEGGCLHAADRFAPWRVFQRSMVIVIGPTPPGTGVIKEARLAASSNSTSPQSLSSALRFIPTSMTTAPSLIQDPLTNCAWPIAATTMSAWRTFSARSFVLEWAMVTVAFFCMRSRAVGLPTIFDRPTMMASFPSREIPADSNIFMIPNGVQG